MSSDFAVDLSKVPSIGIILDPHREFPAWRLKVEDYIEGRYGGPATSILTNVDYVLSRPKPKTISNLLAAKIPTSSMVEKSPLELLLGKVTSTLKSTEAETSPMLVAIEQTSMLISKR